MLGVLNERVDVKFLALTMSGSLAHRRCSTKVNFSGMILSKRWGRQLPHILSFMYPRTWSQLDPSQLA